MENNNQSSLVPPTPPRHRLFGEPETISVNSSNTPLNVNSPAKNYSPIYWNLFGIGWILSLANSFVKIPVLNLIIFVLTIIWVIYFCKITNEAFKTIGKSKGWLLGLLSIVPFGFWVVFLVVRHYLIPKGMWVSKNQSFKLTKAEGTNKTSKWVWTIAAVLAVGALVYFFWVIKSLDLYSPANDMSAPTVQVNH